MIFIQHDTKWASQAVLVVRDPPASAAEVRDMGPVPAWGRSLGGGHRNPLQHSCLGNPTDRGAWWATVRGVTELGTAECLSTNRLWDPLP